VDLTKFKGLLDEQNTWPEYYTFKFVIKTEDKARVIALLDGFEISERASKNGKFTSISSRKIMSSSDEVVAVYEEVSKVEGVISL